MDPASAVAVSKCLLSRHFPSRRGDAPEGLADIAHEVHPEPCLWEMYSRAELVAMLDDFNAEAGYDIARNVHRSPTVQAFRRLPRVEQVALVRAAQYGQEEAAA